MSYARPQLELAPGIACGTRPGRAGLLVVETECRIVLPISGNKTKKAHEDQSELDYRAFDDRSISMYLQRRHIAHFQIPLNRQSPEVVGQVSRAAARPIPSHHRQRTAVAARGPCRGLLENSRVHCGISLLVAGLEMQFHNVFTRQ